MRMKQVEIYANFEVGDNLDPELLEEAMEAAMMDVLLGVPSEQQKIDWGDLVETVQVSLLPPALKNSDF